MKAIIEITAFWGLCGLAFCLLDRGSTTRTSPLRLRHKAAMLLALFGPIGGLLALWNWLRSLVGVHVSQAEAQDLGYIASIIGSYWRLAPEVAMEEARQYVGRLSGRAAFVAKIRGRNVGLGFFDPQNDEISTAYSPWFLLLWVEPGYRCRGVAWAITLARLEHARNTGYRAVFLDTANAEQYHLRRGWRRVDTATFHGTPVAILRYDIPPGK